MMQLEKRHKTNRDNNNFSNNDEDSYSKKLSNGGMDPSPTPVKPTIQISANDLERHASMAMTDAAAAGAANDAGASAGEKGEEDITKDDLQAMKDMIGDIKKDPSLLYRLSSLPGGNNNAQSNAPAPVSVNKAAAVNHASHVSNHHHHGGRNAVTAAANGSSAAGGHKIFVDDEATEVSSLGMLSSGDYTWGTGGGHAAPRHHHHHHAAAPSPRGATMKLSSGNRESAAAFAHATAATATAVRRTNHDAEIALRMQSLRAKRGFSQPRYSPMKNSNSSLNVGGLTASAAATAAMNAASAGGVKNITPLPPSPPHQASNSPEVNSDRKAPEMNDDRGSNDFDTGEKQSEPRQASSPMRSGGRHRSSSESNKIDGREGGRAINDDGERGARAKSASRRKAQPQAQPQTREIKGEDSDDSSENSMSLVVYDNKIIEEKKSVDGGSGSQEKALITSSRGAGGGGYKNYAAESYAANPQLPTPTTSATPHYHSAVSKYVVDEKQRSSSRSNNAIRGGGQQQQGDSDRRRPSSSKGGGRRSVKEGMRSKMERKLSRSRERKNRSRSELPRQRGATAGGGGGNKDGRARGNSEQPKQRKMRGTLEQSKERSKQQHEKTPRGSRSFHGQQRHSVDERISSSTRRRGSRRSSRKHQGDPPSSQQQRERSTSSTPLDKRSLIESLRAEQQESSKMLLNRNQEGVDDDEERSLDPWQNDEFGNERTDRQATRRGTAPPASMVREASGAVASLNQGQNQQQQQIPTKATPGRDMPHGDSFEERKDLVGSLPEHHLNGQGLNGSVAGSGLCPSAVVAPSSHPVGHNLSQMGMLDQKLEQNRFASSGTRRRPSLESESGKSLVSRLSRRRGLLAKKSAKRSDADQGGSSHVSNDSSPMKFSGSDGSGDNHVHYAKEHSQHSSGHSFHKGLVSRISHNFPGASPKVGNRRRLASADSECLSATANSSDALEKLARADLNPLDQPAHLIANDDSDHVTLGIELAIRSGQVPRLCDERGRCLFHPHIRLQKPKLFGGWKVLFQHCPDCAVEHMKKTQEKLATIQMKQKEKRGRETREEREQRKEREREHKKEKKKSKRSKDRRKSQQDPIIGKNVGDEHFTAEQKKSKKKRDRKKEKERLRQELAASSAKLTAGSDEPEQARQVADDGNNQQRIDRKGDEAGNVEPTAPQHQTDRKEEKAIDSEQHVPQQQPQSQPREQNPMETQPSTPSDPLQDQSLALVPHKKPKKKRVNGLPWSDYNGHSGRYTGEVNEQFLPHGKGEMVYDQGSISSGVWYNGVLDTEEDEGGGGGGGGGGGSRSHQPPAMTNEPPEVLPNYAIGDKGRDSDMIITPKRETAASVAKIRVGDAAWVRRSDGSWTYAVVKDRTHGNEHDEKGTIRFKVNLRGSTKAFPTSQWGTYVRRIKKPAHAPDAPSSTGGGASEGGRTLGDFLDNNNASSRASGASSFAGGIRYDTSGDVSVSSAHSAPMLNGSGGGLHNLTTGKMKIRTRSRSRSRNRKNVTTLPLLFSSSMSVSEEADDGRDNDDWETASGSGYRLRGIDP